MVIASRSDKNSSDTSSPDLQKFYSKKEVSKHNSLDDIWIIIEGNIYDLTSYQYEHPGGQKILSLIAGKDATKKFRKYHRPSILAQYDQKLRIAKLESNPPSNPPPELQKPSTFLFGLFLSRKGK